jgi:hypothetical protein
LVDLGDIFELELLVECDLELRLQIMSAKVELDLWILVADELLVVIDDSVRKGGVEGVLENCLSLGIGRLSVEVDEEAIGRAGNPFYMSDDGLNIVARSHRDDSHSSRSIVASF